MEKMLMVVRKLWKEEEGTETVEWAVVAGLLILAATVIWGTVGGQVNTIMTSLSTALAPAVP